MSVNLRREPWSLQYEEIPRQPDAATVSDGCADRGARPTEATFEVIVADFAAGERVVYVWVKGVMIGTSLGRGKRKRSLKFVKREINRHMRTLAFETAHSGTDRSDRSVG